MNDCTKNIHLILLVLFCSVVAHYTAQAQITSQLLHAPKGIAVFFGDTLATTATPLQGYIVHRKTQNSDWQRITPTPIRLNTNPAVYYSLLGEKQWKSQLQRLGFSSDEVFFQYLTASGRADTAAALLLQSSIAELFGLLYIDKEALSGEVYQYGVSSVYNGVETPIRSLGSIKAGAQVSFSAINAPGVRMRDNNVEIMLQSISTPFGVRIERSDSADVFRPIANILLDSASVDSITIFIDTSAPLGSIVQYRVIAFDYLGNSSTPSTPSTLLVLNPKLSGFTLQARQQDNSVELSWSPNAPCAACRFVVIRRAIDSSSANYRVVDTVAASETSYRDTDILPNKLYFYTLQYLGYNGSEGDISASVQAYSRLLTPPVAPAMLRTESVQTGIMLRWSPSVSPEIEGYIVYRSSSPEDSLIQISNNIINDTVYTDTSLALSLYSSYFYAVAARNTAGVVGDITPLVAGENGRKAQLPTPNALDYLLDITSVILRWQDELPYIPALAGYNIYRQGAQDSSPVRLNDSLLPSDRLTFRDSSPFVGETARYFITTVDIRKNESPFSEAINVAMPALLLPRPTGVRAFPAEGSISLRWNATADNRVSKFIILRSVAGAAYSAIAEIPSGSSSFSDKGIEQGKVYYYKIVAASAQGVNSPESTEVMVLP